MPVQEYSGDYFIKLLKDLSQKTGVTLPQVDMDTLTRLVDEERQRDEAVKTWMRTQDSKINMSSLDLPFYPILSRAISVDTSGVEIQIPGDYKHLVMFISARTDRAASSDVLNGRFNDDTGTNYMEAYSGEAATVSSYGEQTSRTSIIFSAAMGATATAGSTGSAILFIPNYSSNLWKTVIKIHGFGITSPAAMMVLSAFSVWKSTEVIKKINVFSEYSANIVPGSIVSIYGVK